MLVKAEDEKWVITKEAHYNLQHQIKDLEIISEINPNDLIDQILYLNTENNMGDVDIAQKLDISVDKINMIINKVVGSKHKSNVPECPKKTVL